MIWYKSVKQLWVWLGIHCQLSDISMQCASVDGGNNAQLYLQLHLTPETITPDMPHRTLRAATFPYASTSGIQDCCQQRWVVMDALSWQKQSINLTAQETRTTTTTSAVIGILVPNRSYPGVETQEKHQSWHLQQLSGLKCARFDLFVGTHSSWGQGSIYATVFELQANITETSKPPQRLLFLPPQRGFAPASDKGWGEDETGETGATWQISGKWIPSSEGNV